MLAEGVSTPRTGWLFRSLLPPEAATVAPTGNALLRVRRRRKRASYSNAKVLIYGHI